MIAETQNIRDLRQWVCWRREQRDGKPTKVPYSPLTGERASSTDPNSWASYSEAVAAYKEHGYDGIGFTFTKEDDFVGIDLDNCLSPDSGEVEPWAQEIIDELDSYAEVSPSGTGVHILVRATLPEGRNRKGPIEMYSHGRYFTVTGRHLEGTPRAIESRQQALEEVVRQVFEEKPESANGHKKEWSPYRNGLSDQEILAAAIRSKTRKKFSQLWTGEISGYDSTSEADQALCPCWPSGPDLIPGGSTHSSSSPGSIERSGRERTTGTAPYQKLWTGEQSSTSRNRRRPSTWRAPTLPTAILGRTKSL
jgi:putative DNA primase/helicase